MLSGGAQKEGKEAFQWIQEVFGTLLGDTQKLPQVSNEIIYTLKVVREAGEDVQGDEYWIKKAKNALTQSTLSSTKDKEQR